MEKVVLGAKPRHFLKRLNAKYADNYFLVSHKEIANNFDMPPSTVNKYLKLLVESGHLLQQETKDIFKGKGSAKYQYRISDAGLELLGAFTFSNPIHEYLITQVQSENFKIKLKINYDESFAPKGEERYAVNTDDCALLLEVLLCKADLNGYVINLTRQKISNLVGFNTAKVLRLTKILTSMGFISHITPGLSGFFGIQSSVYQLCLNHLLYTIETQKPVIKVDLKYADKYQLPSGHLIGMTQSLKTSDLEKINSSNDRERYEALKNLNANLTAPNFKMITYCNSLMTIFAIRVLSKSDDLNKLIAILKGDVENDETDIRANIIGQLEELLDSTILSSEKISNTDKVVKALSPFFLENALNLNLLILELEKLGYEKLISLNTTIVSLKEPQLKVIATFESQEATEGVECNNYNARLHKSWRSQQQEVVLEPDLRGLI
ncbi:hypothetical protein AAD001_16860 [Colwelliaceae bacterium 6471]